MSTEPKKMAIPRLETERLLLRPFCLYDVKPYFRLASDPKVLDTTDMPHANDEVSVREWVMSHGDGWSERSEMFLLITSKQTREIIGSISLFTYDRHKKADVGYWIVPSSWGNGYATEAASVVIGFAFDELRLHKLEANHLERNAVSGRVLQKLGFIPEGLLRDGYLKGDKFENLKLYGMLKREYLEQKDK